MASSTAKKRKGNAAGKNPAKGGKLVPALCNIIGMLLLLGVIALCLPLTVPRIMGYEVYDVVSGSMEPAIPVGSAVLVKPTDAAQLQEGDIVAYYAVKGSNVRPGGAVMDDNTGAGAGAGGDAGDSNGEDAGEGADSADATEDDGAGYVGVADDGEAAIVVHRVVTNRSLMGELVTKGDANNVEDLNPIPYDNVIGRVETSIPMIGAFMAIYASTAGKVYLLLTAACGVMLNMLAGRMRIARRDRVEQIAEAAAEVGLTPEAAENMLYGTGEGAMAGQAGSQAAGQAGAGVGVVTGQVPGQAVGQAGAGEGMLYGAGDGANTGYASSYAVASTEAAVGGARHAAQAGVGSIAADSASLQPGQGAAAVGQGSGSDKGQGGGSGKGKDTAKKRRGAKLRIALAAVLAVVFLGSAGVVGYVNWQYQISDALYHDTSDRFTEDGDGSGEIAPKKVDFKALQAENPDIVGWIYCKDTVIDYPVLKGKDNDQYLYHDYTGAYNIDGSIFVDAENRDGFVDSNTIVYGHHMNSGSMFAGLIKWADQDYYKKHKVIWLLTPEQDYKIQLFAGHHVDAHSEAYDIAQVPSIHLYSILAKALEDSDFKADVAPTPQLVEAMPKAKQWALDNEKMESVVEEGLVVEKLDKDKKPHVPSASELAEIAKAVKDLPPANPKAKIQLGTEDKYVMLSTCAYLFDNDRYVLNGKLVPVASAGGKKK